MGAEEGCGGGRDRRWPSQYAVGCQKEIFWSLENDRWGIEFVSPRIITVEHASVRAKGIERQYYVVRPDTKSLFTPTNC
jgi:hypothetical protein